MRRIRPHLTYANVMSTIAVFAVLAGGSAWAASQIGTKAIKDGAVTAAKLHSDAVITSKIKNGAVTGAKVDTSSLGAVPEAKIGMSPLAYALVRPDGTVDASHSRGVTDANVANPGSLAGTFCIKGMTGVKTAVVSAVPLPEGGFPAVDVKPGFGVPFPVPECDGAQFTVGTAFLPYGGSPQPEDLPFYIWFFN